MIHIIPSDSLAFLVSLSSRTLYRVYLALLDENSDGRLSTFNYLHEVSGILRRRGFWEGEHTR